MDSLGSVQVPHWPYMEHKQVYTLAVHKFPPNLLGFPKSCNSQSLQKIPLQILLFISSKIYFLLFFIFPHPEKSLDWSMSPGKHLMRTASLKHTSSKKKVSPNCCTSAQLLPAKTTLGSKMSSLLEKNISLYKQLQCKIVCHRGKETLYKKKD